MINCSTYFFEGIKRGYYQYPLDSLSEQFKSYQDHFNCDSQIVVHRHPNLVYYTYMRKLLNDNGNGCFGISIVINGLETSSIKSLFRLFERVFQSIVSEGIILTIDASGNITPKEAQFASFAKHFDQISDNISSLINAGRSSFVPMMPVNYSASWDDYVCISLSEGDSTLKERLTQFNVLYITNNNETSSPELNGLAVRIKNLSEQLEYLKERNQELEKKLSGHDSSTSWKSFSFSLLAILVVLVLGLVYCINCGLLSLNIP